MKMKGYKGFNPDWTCRDKQYTVGETYEEEAAKLCESGIHFCECPLDILNYYPPVGANMELNKFAVVEADDVSLEKADDTKRVCKKIKIQAELNFAGLAKAAVEYIREQTDSDNTKSATGYRSVSSNTGYQSVSSNTGDRSVASNTGDQSVAKVEGAESVALSIGYKSAAAASLGSWIVLAEWGNKGGEYHIIDVKSARVDGDRIKPDTLYRLENGEFVEASDAAD